MLLLALCGVVPAGGQEPVVELVGEGVVSTARNETFPAEDPVTGSLWFSVYDSSFDDQTIMYSVRTASGLTEPQLAPFSGKWGDRAPRFSIDGSVVYFTSNRPRSEGEAPGDMNIWRVRRTGDKWSDPELLEAPVNSSANDMHSVATRDALWVASNRPEGRGRSDIYRVTWEGEISHLGPTINDELSQPDLWVNSPGDTMILVISNHPQGLGGDDLYLIRFDGESWSMPSNLGPGINTDEYEYGPTVSGDGRYMYFTSHRSGNADVYRVAMSAVLGESSE